MKYSTTANIPSTAASAWSSRFYLANRLSSAAALEKKNRALSVACYFGFAPLLWASGVIHQRNRLVNHHMLYSLAFSFAVLCILVFELVTDWIQYWLMVSVWNPSMAEFDASVVPMWLLCRLMVIGTILGAAIFGLAWGSSVVAAWRGRTPQIPLIASIASRYGWVRFGMYFSIFVEILAVLSIGLAVSSIQISNALPEKGDVYILYTQGGYLPIDGFYETYTPPRWAVTMAFYPLVRAGLEKFGDRGVAVLPLSETSFNEAIHDGRFIFVASHGGYAPGAFTISNQPYKQILPTDVAPHRAGPQLQYAYFAGCWTGGLESEWRQVLGLEHDTMFDRISFVDEHMLWVWLNSPKVVKGLN